MIIDSEVLSNLCDQTMELEVSVGRLKAVIQSFSDEYVDVEEKEALAAMTYRFEHFTGLFNVISFMVADLEEKAKALDDGATAAFTASRNKPLAEGVG